MSFLVCYRSAIVIAEYVCVLTTFEEAGVTSLQCYLLTCSVACVREMQPEVKVQDSHLQGSEFSPWSELGADFAVCSTCTKVKTFVNVEEHDPSPL